MKEIDSERNLISRILTLKGKEYFFSGWGFEMGNWYSFFSLEKMGGLNSEGSDISISNDGGTFETRGIIALENGRFSFLYTDEFESGKVYRSLTLTVISEEAYLGDLAIRTCIPGRFKLQLNSKLMKPKKRFNLYNVIPNPSTLTLDANSIKVKTSLLADGFERADYLRFQRDGNWILHTRGLSFSMDEVFSKTIKGNRIKKDSWLLKTPPLRGLFTYARERLYPGMSFQICHNKRLQKGESIILKEEMDFG